MQYQTERSDLWFSLTLTAGTTAYHLVMRCVVGAAADRLTGSRDFYKIRWFQEKAFEKGLYRAIKVKKWKHRAGTYDPDKFSLKKNSLEVVIQNTCTAELVHELYIGLSFASLGFSFLTSDWKSNLWPFLITAVLAAGFDLIFVIIQRYNRPRLMDLCRKRK